MEQQRRQRVDLRRRRRESEANEHPGAAGGVCEGENWTVARINALMQSPYWDRTAIFFTMDDFGGWYDHVAPP